MTLVGDCRSDDTLQIDGRVEGNVEARRAIVIGRHGVVVGDIVTGDAVIYGRMRGRLTVASAVELLAPCAVDGTIETRHLRLEEGARVTASVTMTSQRSTSATPDGTERSARASEPGLAPGSEGLRGAYPDDEPISTCTLYQSKL